MPQPMISVTNFLKPFAFLAVGIIMTAVFWQIAQSDTGRVVLVLVGICYKLVPPFLWLGGLTMVAVWLIVLTHLWRA